MKKILFVLLFLLSCTYAEKMKIGVSLHPYYSFVTNIVEDRAEVVALVENGNNPHGYRPQPADIERAMDIDAVVINGVGHDEFAVNILKAAGLWGNIPTIYANETVPLIPISTNSEIINSHTFVSISASTQQIYAIANELAEINPENGDFYRRNASRFARELRILKMEYMQKFNAVENNDFRCATIHGGYSYLLQEFGFQVDAVIEPAHGLTPSASDLQETIDIIKEFDVQVVFSEQDFPSNFVNTIKDETGVSVVALSHISSGEFRKDSFIDGMRYNLNRLLVALQGDAKE